MNDDIYARTDWFGDRLYNLLVRWNGETTVFDTWIAPHTQIKNVSICTTWCLRVKSWLRSAQVVPRRVFWSHTQILNTCICMSRMLCHVFWGLGVKGYYAHRSPSHDGTCPKEAFYEATIQEFHPASLSVRPPFHFPPRQQTISCSYAGVYPIVITIAAFVSSG